jgi:hypothetical protein
MQCDSETCNQQEHCNAPQGIEVTHNIQKRVLIYLEPEKQQLVAFYLLQRPLAI